MKNFVASEDWSGRIDVHEWPPSERSRCYVKVYITSHDMGSLSIDAGLFTHAFPDLRVEIKDQIAENDQVVTCLQMRGTQKGPLLGIGVSGKTVDSTGVRVDRLTGDKIAESWFHWDGLGMLQQIGALPELVRNPQAVPGAKEPTFSPALARFPSAPRQTHVPGLPAARLKPAA
jgi:hypothetical protein